jgi:hypothetical protein
MEYLLDINNIDESMLSKLKIHSPIPIQGGSYLAKLTLNDNPILFQMPKCSTKKGIISSGKRFYCDLLFKYDDSNVIDFVDSLETIVRNKVLEKNELWFQDPPSLEDIEYNWNESIKQTKQNFYLRTYIGNTKTVKSSISVYNSNQEQISMEDITSSSNIITIVEVTGLKFSSNSFHMNYCLRQVMVLEEKPIFNKCLIHFSKKTQPAKDTLENNENIDNEDIKHLEKTTDTPKTENNKTQIISEKLSTEQTINLGEMADDTKTPKSSDDDLEILNVSNNNLIDESLEKSEVTNTEHNTENDTKFLETPEVSDSKDNDMMSDENSTNNEEEINKQQTSENTNEDTDIIDTVEKNTDNLEIKEVELEMPMEDELFQLKKPDTVYLDIYNKALQKAKEAKIKAIQAYLELKEIKNKYMIQEVDEDDNFGELDLEF